MKRYDMKRKSISFNGIDLSQEQIKKIKERIARKLEEQERFIWLGLHDKGIELGLEAEWCDVSGGFKWPSDKY